MDITNLQRCARSLPVLGFGFLFTFVNFACRAEMVVFSEIIYHPKDNRPEYIEVFNNTATPFDIADWRLAGGISYNFPPFSSANANASFLKAFERIVLSSADELTTRAAYNIPASVRVFGP